MTTIVKQTFSSALVSALAEIEGAAKDKVNPAFKSKYADLGSVIDAIRPVLAKHGLAFTQHPSPVEDGVSVETFVWHNDGTKESLGTLYVPANKRDAQGFGSALTYCRRYALMTAFGVPAEDDDGNAAAKSAPANDRTTNGNGHAASRAASRDAPFPPGPAKNKTELKELGRTFWREVEGCGDPDELDALLGSHAELTKQLVAALPDWWNGGSRDGEPYEGLGSVIAKKRSDLMLAAVNAG